MKLTDYTGKLNSHQEYLEILKYLKKKCRYIEYVLVDGEDTAFIKTFESSIISLENKNKWQGTKSSRKSPVYILKASEEIFDRLRKYETFCKYINDAESGDIAESTDFGINDIAFFDEKELPLLFTTTHEGYIMVRSDLFL